MDVDRDDGMEALSIVPSAVSETARWHWARFMCEKRCAKEGFEVHDIAASLVDGEGRPRTIYLRKTCTIWAWQKEKSQK